MLKKLLLLVIISMLFILSFGCSTNNMDDIYGALDNNPDSETNTVDGIHEDFNNTPTDSETNIIDNFTVPDDFYVIYEFGYWKDRLATLLDTKNNIVGGLTSSSLIFDDFVDISNSSFEVVEYDASHRSYNISTGLLKEIYDCIIQYDIKLYCGPDLLCANTLPFAFCYTKITFCVDEEVFSIFYDGSYDVLSGGEIVIFDENVKRSLEGAILVERIIKNGCFVEAGVSVNW